ncbi:hypothetical protein UPYG_G00274310 [Umbra pygmaea]|uniref:PHD finger protein 21B n=1 Tax=Umbra pygmaea TaxID=75934 RepID=A0ABD0W6C3_UMBPY
MKQDPQDMELKKQLHERHARITAISEKQKLAVRSCPVGVPAKPLPLIKPPAPPTSTQSISISMLPASPVSAKTSPIAMVTAHMNGGQKALSGTAAPGSSETRPPIQSSLINLHTSRAPPGGAGLQHYRREMLGNLTGVPIKVPQVSSLHRLSGQTSAVLPQVRRSLLPDSLPHSPVSLIQEKQPSSSALGLLSLQKATAVVSPKSHAHSSGHTHTLIQGHTQGPALPTANSTFSTDHLSNGQGDTPSPSALSTTPASSTNRPTVPSAAPSIGAGPGVAYAIISTSPTARKHVSAIGEVVKVHPLIFSAESKVIVIQPQTLSSTQIPPLETTPSTSPLSTPAKKKKEQEELAPEKIAFMVGLGLVTKETLEEIHTKRQERKRRSTANPAYSGLFEPERKRLASNYLNNPLILTSRDTGGSVWKEELEHDDHCSIFWVCPKCQKKVLNKENLTWPQNFVQSYVTHKTVREEEKRRLQRRNVELKQECNELEEKSNRLNTTFTQKMMDAQERLLGQQRVTQASLERVKALIRLIQRDQMIQVTMTATTTTDASLLSLPWIKPTSTTSTHTLPPAGPSMLLQQKSLVMTQQQSQPHGNN